MGLVVRSGRVERVAPVAELADWTGPRLAASGSTVLPGLEPGKLADLIVVDGEPDRDVRVLQEHARIRVVMREGRLVVDRRP